MQPQLSKASPQTRFHIYYGVKPYFDRLHARHLAGFPAVELHPTEHRRHGFVRDLARQGELISILQTAIEHPPLDERVDN